MSGPPRQRPTGVLLAGALVALAAGAGAVIVAVVLLLDILGAS